jgi:hypothetical protein
LITPSSELGLRCLFAAVCSADGRSLLVEALDQKTQPHEPSYMLTAFRGYHVPRSDPQWPALMNVAKRYALDHEQPVKTRIAGAMVASDDRDDQAYREQFLRTALVSREENLVAVVVGYLASEEKPFQYFIECTTAWNGSSREVKALMLVALCGRSVRPVPDEHKPAYEQFLETAGKEADPALRRLVEEFAKLQFAAAAEAATQNRYR